MRKRDMLVTVRGLFRRAGSLRVGFIQMNPKLCMVEENVDSALHTLERTEADLVVLPELFNTGYNFISSRQVAKVAEPIPNGYTCQKLIEVSNDRNMTIVAGIAEQSRGNIFNSAIVASDGRALSYRKVHLFYREKKFFKPGHEFKVLGDLGIMICYDWFFPESVRTLMLKGAKIVAHPSNLVHPHCPDAMSYPDAMRMRCIENRVFIVTANRIGNERGTRFIGRSEIVDPNGRILYRASSNREETVVRDIELQEASNKTISQMNDLILDRKPRAYSC